MYICKSSTCSAVYDPDFNWQVSTVESNASTPAVYMQGNNVYCAYVKGGNLYLKVSEDGGITWGAAEQKNDVNGTVIAEKGAVDIDKSGIAFTDKRNGNYEIYYARIAQVGTPDTPTITGPASGKVGKSTDYVFTTTDHEGDQVSYYIDWGDGQNSGWKGPFASGTGITESHTWSTKGDLYD